MDFVLRPRGDGEWRRRRSVCPIKANLYCCQPGEARIGGGLLLPSSFLVMPCSKKKEERDFPFSRSGKKSRSAFLFFLFSVWGSLFLTPPPKKKEQIPNRLASLLGQAFAHICPQFESFSPPKANSCRNPSQPEKEEPSKQSTSFCPFFSPLFFLYVLSLYGSSIV